MSTRGHAGVYEEEGEKEERRRGKGREYLPMCGKQETGNQEIRKERSCLASSLTFHVSFWLSGFNNIDGRMDRYITGSVGKREKKRERKGKSGKKKEGKAKRTDSER